MKQDDKPKRRLFKRSDNAIPDYDYLFNEDEKRKGKSKKGFFGKILKVNRKPIISNEQELMANNRAHSAKLRIIEKL